jgi:hypothetical protein
VSWEDLKELGPDTKRVVKGELVKLLGEGSSKLYELVTYKLSADDMPVLRGYLAQADEIRAEAIASADKDLLRILDDYDAVLESVKNVVEIREGKETRDAVASMIEAALASTLSVALKAAPWIVGGLL